MAQQTENVETIDTPRPGEPGFTPMPHADDAELAEHERLMAEGGGEGGEGAAETEGEQPTGEAEPQAGASQDAGEEPAPEAGAEAGEQGTSGERRSQAIPHWRVKQMVEQARLEGENRALREALQRVGTGTGTPAKAAEPEATPQERIEALEDQTSAALDKLDKGEIDQVEYERIKLANERAIRKIAREEVAAPAAAPKTAATREDLYLAERTQKLAEDYPVLAELTRAQVEPLVKKAYAYAELHDIAIAPDASGDYQLRRIVAHLAQERYGETRAPAPAPRNPTGGPTREAAASKLAAIRGLPPDLPRLAGGGNRGDTGPISEERFLTADVDDLLAVPDSAIASIVARRR